VYDKTPRNDALILLGDFNTKTWKEYSNEREAGRHTLHDIASKNGEKLMQLAIAHNLEILFHLSCGVEAQHGPWPPHS